MELSPERKAEILKEEAQKLAEEKYREQIRLDLHRRSSRGWNSRKITLIVAFIVVSISGATFWFGHNSKALPKELATKVDSGLATTPMAPEHESLEPTVTPKVTDSGPPPKLTIQEIAKRTNSAIVTVVRFNENGQPDATGSGYVFSSNGSIVTNYHVIRGAFRLVVRNATHGEIPITHLLGYDIQHDVAILKADSSGLQSLKTVESVVQIGDRVIAIGSPLQLENSISEGIVSAFRGQIIQTTAAISHGSSGGPLLNEYGNVIGITTATVQGGELLNLALPSRFILWLAEHERTISLQSMRDETYNQVRFSQSISVPPGNRQLIPFTVGPEGATLRGDFRIQGGLGNDLDVALVTASDQPRVITSGRCRNGGSIKKTLTQGKYALIFDNRFSAISGKSAFLDMELASFR